MKKVSSWILGGGIEFLAKPDGFEIIDISATYVGNVCSKGDQIPFRCGIKAPLSM